MHVKGTGILFAVSTTKGIYGRTNFNIHKTVFFHHLLPTCTRQATSDSSGPKIDVRNCRRGHGFAVGDIGELQITTRLQDPKDLLHNLVLVGA